MTLTRSIRLAKISRSLSKILSYVVDSVNQEASPTLTPTSVSLQPPSLVQNYAQAAGASYQHHANASSGE